MTVLAGRYELGDQLGAGGMARVVAAHDLVLDRPVAVKLLAGVPDPVARQRFLREARAAARLRSRNVVAVYDTGEDDGQPYIVMELVSGGSLADRLRTCTRMEIGEALAITAGVLRALGAAHAAGMVHRDVKPANVLLSEDGGVKLGDFGIAKAFDDLSQGLTATGSVLGTPSYLAPELIAGDAPSPPSDVYSVGCLLYAQLAGHPPFPEGDALSVAYAHRHTAVPPIESERPDVSPALAEVVRRALEKDPARRFPDAASMSAALPTAPEPAPDTTVPLAAASTVALATSPPAADRPPDHPAPDADARATDARSIHARSIHARSTHAQSTDARGTDDPSDRTDRLGPVAEDGHVARPPSRAPALLVVVVVVAIALWLLVARPWTVSDDEAGGSDATTTADPEDGDGGPDEPAPDAEGDSGEGAEEPADPPDDADTDEEDAGAPMVTRVSEAIAVLAGAPSGTYGKKHDDLLEELVALSREDEPKDRAEDAEDLHEKVTKWLEKDELDPRIGEPVLALLVTEADAYDGEDPDGEDDDDDRPGRGPPD